MAVIQKSLVGIDIGTKNIKMVKVNAKGKVTHCSYVDLPEKIINNGHVESKQMLVETLKLARRKLGTNFKDCVLCFNSPDIVIRQIVIPQMEEIYIRKNIMLELSGFVPLSPERYVIDYIITEEIETDDKKLFQILVFAVPTDIVQDYSSCLKSAGFKLRYVDIMENAYEKLFKMLKSRNITKDKNYACLYIDNSKASVSVYGNDKFFINKVIDNGASRVFEDIAEKTNRPLEIIKKLLYTNDVFTNSEQFSIEEGVIGKYTRDISFEITRVIDYFKSKNKDSVIDAVYFSGGFSHVMGVQAYYQNSLSIPVIVTSKYLDSMFNDIPQKNNGIDYTNAIAITLREED